MKYKEIIFKETATVGATSAGNIASVANKHIAIGPDYNKKEYAGSPGKSGTKAPNVPKPKQITNPDGTAKNALDIKDKNVSIFGGTIKR